MVEVQAIIMDGQITSVDLEDPAVELVHLVVALRLQQGQPEQLIKDMQGVVVTDTLLLMVELAEVELAQLVQTLAEQDL